MSLYTATSVIFAAFFTLAASQRNEGDRCVDQYTNTIGKCTKAETCNSARENFQKNGIRPTFCTYNAFGTTLVCCTDGSTILQTADPKGSRPIWGTDGDKQNDGRRVSERTDSVYPANNIEKTTPTPSDENVIQHQYKETMERHSTQKGFIANTEMDSKEEELIAKIWALKLKRLHEDQRVLAEKLVNDILFEGGMNTLTRSHLQALNEGIGCGIKMRDATMKTEEKVLVKKSLDSPTDENRLPIVQLQITVNNPEDVKDY